MNNTFSPPGNKKSHPCKGTIASFMESLKVIIAVNLKFTNGCFLQSGLICFSSAYLRFLFHYFVVTWQSELFTWQLCMGPAFTLMYIMTVHALKSSLFICSWFSVEIALKVHFFIVIIFKMMFFFNICTSYDKIRSLILKLFHIVQLKFVDYSYAGALPGLVSVGKTVVGCTKKNKC